MIEWKFYSQCIEVNGEIPVLVRHAFEGVHGDFTGRRYRRGKNRCHICGAPNDAASKTISDRFFERMNKSIYEKLA